MRAISQWLMILAAILPVCAAMPGHAQAQSGQSVEITIAAGTLDAALRDLSQQTGIAVGGTDAGLSRVRTPAVSGQMRPAEALRRLLAGSGYHAVRVGPAIYRIERAPVPAADSTGRADAPAPRPVPPPPPPDPIVITATKGTSTLADYPGSVQLIDLSQGRQQSGPPQLQNVLSAYPQTSGTQLGAGRNKIFVRGIADSSFNGPTQATIGLYLGEQRLIYSAPNPALLLYDIDRVEMLEGPQGTLYGAGTLGGVIRMVPNAPDAAGASAALWSGVSVTERGSLGGDGAAMFNLPLGGDTAVRALAYAAREGGVIEDVERNLENIDRSTLWGGRIAVQTRMASGWTIGLNGFGQRRRTRDGQYINPELPGFARASKIAQPFAGDVLGVNLTVRGYVGALDLVSTTGIVRHDLDTRFDSSTLVGLGADSGPDSGPNSGAVQAFDEARRIQLLSHETRLISPQGQDFSWLAGISLLENLDRYSQLVTSLRGPSPPPFAEIDYRIREYALFGEGRLQITDRLSATLGGRLIAGSAHSIRYFDENVAEDRDDTPLRFLPMAALAWSPGQDLLVYARYQRSYRTGGVTVEREEDGTPNPTQFDPDHLQTAELGLRGRLDSPLPAQISLAAFYTRWSDIQGDLVQAQGFPITRNLGDGWIAGLSARLEVELSSILNVDAALFANRSEIDRLTPEQTVNARQLPNIPDFSASFGVHANIPMGARRALLVDASLNYVGTSYLDIDPVSQVAQGDYLDTQLSAELRSERWTVSLTLSNVLDGRGNRFAFGNPFTVRLAQQVTPLRPRTFRIALSRSF